MSDIFVKCAHQRRCSNPTILSKLGYIKLVIAVNQIFIIIISKISRLSNTALFGFQPKLSPIVTRYFRL